MVLLTVFLCLSVCLYKLFSLFPSNPKSVPLLQLPSADFFPPLNLFPTLMEKDQGIRHRECCLFFFFFFFLGIIEFIFIIHIFVFHTCSSCHTPNYWFHTPLEICSKCSKCNSTENQSCGYLETLWLMRKRTTERKSERKRKREGERG